LTQSVQKDIIELLKTLQQEKWKCLATLFLHDVP
jgi:ABC-type microcin C transport system duplicated ATPase subunit YejF